MPVVVTGANGAVARAVLPALVERGEVRAVVRARAAAEPVRGAGAKVAVLDLEDTGTLATVMDGAHTVIHLAGGLDLETDEAYDAANLGTVVDSLEAATEAGVRRFVFLSSPRAAPDEENAYLRAKGRAEGAIRASGIEHVVLRSTHIVGPGSASTWMLWRGAMRKFATIVLGDGSQRLAPVPVGDVAAALLAADDRETTGSATYGIEGPEVVTADDVAERLAGRRRVKMYARASAPARARRLLGRPVHPALLDLLARDSLRDSPDAFEAFGLAPSPLDLGEHGPGPKPA